jgi:hypothetical protein
MILDLLILRTNDFCIESSGKSWIPWKTQQVQSTPKSFTANTVFSVSFIIGQTRWLGNLLSSSHKYRFFFQNGHLDPSALNILVWIKAVVPFDYLISSVQAELPDWTSQPNTKITNVIFFLKALDQDSSSAFSCCQ